MGIGVAPRSEMRMTGPGTAAISMQSPVLAYRFKGEQRYAQFRVDRAVKLLQSKGMYSPDFSRQLNLIHTEKEGAVIPITTPFIHMDILEARPSGNGPTKSKAIDVFHSIFPGRQYVADGPIEIDSASKVGEGGQLIGGVTPGREGPLMLRIAGSTIRDNFGAIDCHINKSEFEEGDLFSRQISSKGDGLSARAVFSCFDNTRIFGRFDFTSVMAVNSFLEFSENGPRPLTEVQFTRSVLPLGRDVDDGQSIDGLMEQELRLAEKFRCRPSEIEKQIRIGHRADETGSIWFGSLPRAGRITSLAAALVERAKDRAFFNSVILPWMKKVKDIELEELKAKMNMIARCLNPEAAKLI